MRERSAPRIPPLQRLAPRSAPAALVLTPSSGGEADDDRGHDEHPE